MLPPKKSCFCIDLKIGIIFLALIEIGILCIVALACLTVIHRYHEMVQNLSEDVKVKYWEVPSEINGTSPMPINDKGKNP